MGVVWCIIFYSLPLLAGVSIVIWRTSPRAKAFFKFTTYAVFAVLFATLPIPFMFLRPRSSKNALFPAAGLRFVAKHFLGLKCTVNGKQNIVSDSGCVVVINHQSVVDLIALAELWPVMDKCTVISKKEIFYIWPFGLAAWLWGTIFIDRMNGASAKDSINQTGATIRARKARVLMFPEGTRSLKERLLPFKKGAFHLAIASKCPIQPVVVKRYAFLGPHRFDDGDMEICILPAIPTEGLRTEEMPALMEKTYNVMQTHLDLISSTNHSPNNNIDKSHHFD